MLSSPDIQYFLGANSPSGFYSLYAQLIPLDSANTLYIIKGGAGCGKSTLMRRVARQAAQAGETVEYILCSGDPDSLDAVVLPRLKVALVDGTAPHVVEPKYPGVVEEYVNLGKAYNRAGLAAIRGDIMSAMDGYKEHYQRAYRCLDAAGEIMDDVRATVLTQELEQRLAKRARGIVSREIKAGKGKPEGTVRQRFLDGVTHKGVLTLYDTAFAQCPRIYQLEDSFGLAHTMLSVLLSAGVQAGLDAVACPDPMFPERLRHLLLPQLGLGFVSTAPAQPCPSAPYRRLRLDAMADSDLMRRSRPRLRFSKKVSAALVEEAVSSLAQAKALHDDLEALYNPYVDFHLVEETADAIARDILSLAAAQGD